MIPVFISELKEWLDNWSRYTIAGCAAVMALFSATSMLRPEICFIVLFLCFIILGSICGRERRYKVKFNEWISSVKFSNVSVLTGKITGIIVIGLIHIVFLLPYWVFIVIVWGIRPASVLMVLSSLLYGLAVVGCLTLTGEILSPIKEDSLVYEKDSFLRRFLIFSWLVLTAAVPFFRNINPFFQIYNFSLNDNCFENMISFFEGFFVFILIMGLTVLIYNINDTTVKPAPDNDKKTIDQYFNDFN